MPKPHLLVVGGSTASGKSAAAVEICLKTGGEVISADSMQVYRGMRIGTAQPAPEEMRGIVHRLIGFLPPEQPFTANAYRDAALPCVRSLLARGITPVVCGGTGLYIDALTRPMSLASPSDELLRARLHAEAEEPGGKRALHERLRAVDPQSAGRLHENDLRRVIRALEIYELTGRTMTEQMEEDSRREGDFDVSLYALSWPRELLYDRINRRVDRMMDEGLAGEVQALLDAGVPRDATAMQALGYKEIAQALCGERTMQEAVEAVKLGSRRYAKRQETWFHRDKRCVWLSAEGKTSAELAQEILYIEREKGCY